MIPLRDVIPSRTTPFVTIGLIAANVLAFWYQLSFYLSWVIAGLALIVLVWRFWRRRR